MHRLALVAACWLVANAAVANAAVIYDFESPTYTAGGINGQDGWTGGGAAIITTVAPDQLLRIGSNQSASHSLVGSGFASTTTVSFRSFITNNTSSYAEMQLFDSNSTKYAHIGFQNSNDHFYIYDNVGINNVDTNPVSGGEYYDVTVTLDFAAQKYRSTFFHLNSATMHSDSGFLNFVAGTTAVLAEGGQISFFGGASTNRFAHFDNVTVVPEPTALLMSGFGLVGAALVVRRCSK